MNVTLKDKWGWGIAFMMITGVFILQLPDLSLPFYWDEAWSYGPAIRKMVDHGPSLLPGSIPADSSRGHPLLFYFLAASWLSIFPDTLFFSHLFALTVSVIFLAVFFKFAKKFFGTENALASLLILSVQALLLSHASILLPEILLALLTLLVLYTYLSGKRLICSFFITLLLLTKETGIALFLTILIYDIATRIRQHEKGILIFRNLLLLSGVPVLFTGLFFLLQRHHFGWYFYPEHIRLISLNIADMLTIITSYSAYLFLYLGHNALTLSMIAAMVSLIVRKKNDSEHSRIILLFLLFTVIYILILGFNFYTTRYILSLLPLYILTAVYFIFRALEGFRIIRWVGVIVFATVTIFYSYTPNSKGNAIAYMDDIRVSKEAVQYMEKAGLYDRPVATHFLMSVNLTNPVPGYLSSSRVFTRVRGAINDDTEYAILSSQEENPELNLKVEQLHPRLLVTFKQKLSWCRIYRIKK